MEEARLLIIQAFNKALEQGVILDAVAFQYRAHDVSAASVASCNVRLVDIDLRATIKAGIVLG